MPAFFILVGSFMIAPGRGWSRAQGRAPQARGKTVLPPRAAAPVEEDVADGNRNGVTGTRRYLSTEFDTTGGGFYWLLGVEH
jgi:hypothetical protein